MVLAEHYEMIEAFLLDALLAQGVNPAISVRILPLEGEVNGVAPDDMAQGDDPYEMKADDDGVVFVTVTLDPDKRHGKSA